MKISEDQNEIELDSGAKFIAEDGVECFLCSLLSLSNCDEVPCCAEDRGDGCDVIFKEVK
jgi:hypothetical protein